MITSDLALCPGAQFLRLVKMPNDPKACQRALLLSKSSAYFGEHAYDAFRLYCPV